MTSNDPKKRPKTKECPKKAKKCPKYQKSAPNTKNLPKKAKVAKKRPKNKKAPQNKIKLGTRFQKSYIQNLGTSWAPLPKFCM